MASVTRRLTSEDRDQLRKPSHVLSMGLPYLTLPYCVVQRWFYCHRRRLRENYQTSIRTYFLFYFILILFYVLFFIYVFSYLKRRCFFTVLNEVWPLLELIPSPAVTKARSTHPGTPDDHLQCIAHSRSPTARLQQEVWLPRYT